MAYRPWGDGWARSLIPKNGTEQPSVHRANHSSIGWFHFDARITDGKVMEYKEALD